LTALAGDLSSSTMPEQWKVRDEAVDLLGRLLAPFVPHMAEAIYQASGPKATSVHLAGWPAES
jgi:leucyl-tRNA synthetase